MFAQSSGILIVVVEGGGVLDYAGMEREREDVACMVLQGSHDVD